MTKCCSHETFLHFGPQGIPLEYLLLPPRSALGAATLRVAPRAALRPPRTPTRRDIRRPALANGASPRRSSISGTLEHRQFLGLIHLTGEFLHTP